MKKICASTAVCFLLLGCAPSAEEGLQFYNSKQYDKARTVFEKRTSDPVALVYLYKIFWNGKGVERNEKQALDYLRAAVKLEDPAAQEEFAKILFHGYGSVPMDKEQALSLYEQAAAKGRKTAYIGIGDYYASPPSRSNEDRGKAAEFYQKAEGTLEGDWNLAYRYEQGDGVRQDPQRSYQFIRAVAMAQGRDAEEKAHLIAAGKMVLAEYYLYGYGVDPNPHEAVKMAALVKDEHTDAAAFYAWLLFWGHGIEADPQQAVRIWQSQLDDANNKRRGQKIGLNPYAIHGLAVAYQDGIGTQKDPAKAAQLKGESMFGTWHADAWLRVKYNALGYLDKVCTDTMVLPQLDPGRYKPLKADALLAVAGCMPQATLEQKIAVMEVAGQSYELGNLNAAVLRGKIYAALSPVEREAYMNRLAYDAAAKRTLNDLLARMKATP